MSHCPAKILMLSCDSLERAKCVPAAWTDDAHWLIVVAQVRVSVATMFVMIAWDA